MHFQKIRKLTTASRVIAPSIVFVAFLVYLKHGILMGVLASSPACALLLMFPGARPQPKQNASIQDLIIPTFYVAAAFCFSSWVQDMPWFQELWKQLISREGIGDWRLILTVYLWCCAWCFSMIIQARAMTDDDILRSYQSDDQAFSER